MQHSVTRSRPFVRHDLDTVSRLQQLKTGALIGFSIEAGAILGRVPPEGRVKLRAYAHDLGLAFQIADDLLDVEGDAAAMGKAARKDAAKATLHAASDIETAKRRLAALTAEAIAALTHFGTRAETLREAAAFVARRER